MGDLEEDNRSSNRRPSMRRPSTKKPSKAEPKQKKAELEDEEEEDEFTSSANELGITLEELENLRRNHEFSGISLIYRLMDITVSCFIIFPMVIAFIHGTWKLLDICTNEYRLWGITESLVVGFIIPFGFYYFQDPIGRYIDPHKMKFVYFYMITRFLLVFHCICFVSQYKGVWDLLDFLFPGPEIDDSSCKEFITPFKGTPVDNRVASITTSLVAILIAIVFRVFSNVLGTPLLLGVDDATTIHVCPLRFSTNAVESPYIHLPDCLFSVVVVQSLVITIWRGTWYATEYYFWPNDRQFSIIMSTVIGLVLIYGLGLLQPYYFNAISKLEGHSRIGTLAFINYIAFFGCVHAWRSGWELFDAIDGHTVGFDDSLLFDESWKNHLAVASVGITGAMIFGFISTIVVKGVVIDGELADTVNEDWGLSYVSLLQNRENSVPFPEPWILRFCCSCTRKVQKSEEPLDEIPFIPMIPPSPPSEIMEMEPNSDYTSKMLGALDTRIDIESPAPLKSALKRVTINPPNDPNSTS